MVSKTSSTLSSAKSEAKALLSQRDGMEAELDAALSHLSATGIQPGASVVDKEAHTLACTRLNCNALLCLPYSF
jgi:hypothetical protein